MKLPPKQNIRQTYLEMGQFEMKNIHIVSACVVICRHLLIDSSHNTSIEFMVEEHTRAFAVVLV